MSERFLSGFLSLCVSCSSAVSFPCVWAVPACVCLCVCDFKACLPSQSLLVSFKWNAVRETGRHTHTHSHTQCTPLIQCYILTDTHTSPELPGGCSLLVVQQEKPDEASPHQLHCPLPAFLSHSFPTFHLAVSGISSFYSFFSLCHILKKTFRSSILAFFSFVFLSSLSSDPPYPILPLHIPSILKLIKLLI